MQLFTAQEQNEIEAAITRAESATSGEIVVVVTEASDGYRSFAVLWAALVALAVPLPFIWATQISIEYVYLAQLAVFLAAAILFLWEPVRFALAPGSVKRARCHQKAVEQFLAQSLHTTRGRTGVLIYVSFAEHYAEVIADEGIYKKVKPDVWNDVIAELTAHLARGQRTQGFVKAIERCGAILAEHFPPGRADHNELPNHLIVLDAFQSA
jgi:putative membrane protein